MKGVGGMVGWRKGCMVLEIMLLIVVWCKSCLVVMLLVLVIVNKQS